MVVLMLSSSSVLAPACTRDWSFLDNAESVGGSAAGGARTNPSRGGTAGSGGGGDTSRGGRGGAEPISAGTAGTAGAVEPSAFVWTHAAGGEAVGDGILDVAIDAGGNAIFVGHIEDTTTSFGCPTPHTAF